MAREWYYVAGGFLLALALAFLLPEPWRSYAIGVVLGTAAAVPLALFMVTWRGGRRRG